jgi:hypothetical protein
MPHVPRTTQKIGNPYKGTLDPLAEHSLAMLKRNIGFLPLHITIARPQYAHGLGRIGFPVLAPNGTRQGWCLRSYTGMTPKALTFMDNGSTKLSYYKRHKGSDVAILVEDIPSAVRAAVYINSVALLGTSIAEDERLELAETFSRVVIALDADATATAIRLQRELSGLFKEVDVLVLPTDIKDLDEADVKELLEGLA